MPRAVWCKSAEEQIVVYAQQRGSGTVKGEYRITMEVPELLREFRDIS